MGREANAHVDGCYGGRSWKSSHLGGSQERGLWHKLIGDDGCEKVDLKAVEGQAWIQLL